MIQRVIVAGFENGKFAETFLHGKKVIMTRVFSLEGITMKQAHILAEKLFCEKLVQKYALNIDIVSAQEVVEVAYKPGVMNPEVASIIKGAKDLGIDLQIADSATRYYFLENIKKGEGRKVIEALKLFNPTVEHIVESLPKTLLIEGVSGKIESIGITTMTDQELLDLSQDTLFLNLDEMKVIQSYFKKINREPRDGELETIAQTWSEHCAHKTFKAKLIVDGKKKKPLISRLINESKKHNKLIVSSFIDNSGIMEFYDGMSICAKVETHNSPSAIEPYGGAATGSGGVFRDILGTGQGAKTIASTDIFCFAYPNMPFKFLPEGCLPPDYLLKRVVTGVKDYGNRMGIPTNNGSVHFHNDFRAKPTVIVGGYGIIPTRYAQKGKAKKGDAIVVIGGKTGRDGIHGATFSSAEMTHKTVNINSSAVQIGNAIEEKRMFDAILEASSLNLIRAIQDCGAGGFSSAVGEMGEEIGIDVDISKAPLKYQGLSPWEIWVSESQERMAAAISKKNLKKFLQVCKKYNVEATVLGEFTGKKKITVRYKKEILCDLDVAFLYHGLPRRNMVARKVQKVEMIQKKNILKKSDILLLLKKILKDENIASKEPIVRLYDHTVQGTNAMQPYVGEKLDGPTDGSVMRPILKKPYGMVISHGLNPILNRIDPYRGSMWAVVEALSNYTAIGGNIQEASLINNYIWPFPDEVSLWELDKSVDAVVNAMKIFKTPVISGKDSLSSTYRGKDGTVIKIPPVLCISVFGRIPDVSKTVSSDFKNEGSVICLLGKQDVKNMGGSMLYQMLHVTAGNVPLPDLKKLPLLLKTLHKAISTGNILACHDVSEGGIITALFEMSVGGGMGVKLALDEKNTDVLFNETPGTFIVEVESRDIAKKLFKNIPYKVIGKTIPGKKIILNTQQLHIDELVEVWKEPMKKLFT